MSFKAIKDTINVGVKNNTSFIQNVNLLGGTSDPLAVPPHLLYQWDLSTETYFGSVTATILISTTANPTPVLYTVPVNGYNIEAVLFALNSLNLGIFQVSGNIIYVSNDFYIYGALTILSTAFVSTWDTNNTSGSSSASNQVKLPLYNGGTYNFTVDWGDGTQNTITSWNQAETLHTYASAGVYTIGIVGTITEWSFLNSAVDDCQKILSILSWGSLQFGTLDLGSFSNCIDLDLSSVTDVPDLSSTITLDNAFSFCTNLTTINNSNSWDTTNVNLFIAMFFSCVNFDSNISNWDMANATNINTMFQGCTSFNQPIGSWDVSSVTNMSSLFTNCTQFNQPLNSWNVSLVTDMNSMFGGATNFNGNISSWNTSNATVMLGMFNNASSFNQNISSWDVSNVQLFISMFENATNFNQPIGSWNVSSVTDMNSMFVDAFAFNQDIGSWDISNVTNLSNFMFGKTFNDFSTTNLNAIYNGWSLLSVQPNLTNVNFGTIKYTAGGQAGKNILTGAPNNWVIIDGGI